MCFGGAARAANQARQQAAFDAQQMRNQMESDRSAMQAEAAKNREEVGRTAAPPAPYRLKGANSPANVKRKKGARSTAAGATSLRIPMNTGGGASGGVNIG